MTTPQTGNNKGQPAAHPLWFHRRESLVAYFLVLFAVAFNLYHLYPEVVGDAVSRNDHVFHLLMIEMAVEAITQGLDFTDPWQGSMGMGYPLFHYYHHFPHVTIALVHVLTLGTFAIADLLRWITYLLLSFFPLSVFWSMRYFGFDRLPAAMGGLVAPLITTSGILGFGFISYVFQGWGVHAQLWAMVLLPPAVAVGYRVLQDGRGYFWAALLLAATLMSHVMYGYMAFLTLGILTLIQPTKISSLRSFWDTMWPRWLRLIILAVLVGIVTSYFLVPAFLDRAFLNNSVFHDSIKYDSYGHAAVLQGLVVGHLFDFNRLPVLTVLLGVGLAICIFRWRQERYLIPVAIFFFWLMLYFGRSTWGPLIDLLPMSTYLHMNRFIAGVHLGGILLIGVALATPWHWALSRKSIWYAAAAAALTVLVLSPAYMERRSYLAENAFAINQSQRAVNDEDNDLTALFETLEQLPPGRVYAGQQRGSVLENWSSEYRIGSLGVDDLLHAKGLDMVGKVYHSYSLNSDVLINFDEQRYDHYNLYNARYVVAPEGQIFPEFVQPLQQFGRHRLYQVDTTGYFDLVGSDLAFEGTGTELYLAASVWLGSRLPGAKQHPLVSIGSPAQEIERVLPLSSAREVIAKLNPPDGPSRGTIISEEIGNNYFAADVNVERESMLLLKATYHPNWRATVDGVKTDTVMLMPSFVGVRLPPGEHNVRIEYRPRRLRMILLGLGLLTLPMVWLGEKRGEALSRRLVSGVSARISGLVKRPNSIGGRQNRRGRRRR